MDLLEKLLESKYKISKKNYNKKFTKENPELYLFFFDIMNVYPLFPTPLTFDIRIGINNSPNDIEKIISLNNNKSDEDHKFKKLGDRISSKINEFESIPRDIVKNRARPFIRKLFSYEIIDEISNNYGGEHVTVAWLKCYEIITYYDMIDNFVSHDTINYFGICEQPGAFVYAINHYIKTKLDKKFNFIIESLVDPNNKKIFRPAKELYEKYKNNYDYGYDGTGDVTNVDNIIYYRNKYKNTKFNIITADCGLDCSDDFSKQESNMFRVIMGQLLLAISISSEGTNYFFKLFTTYEKSTHNLLYLAGLFFEDVKLCRTLTTKPESGEIYCICKKFKKIDNIDNILGKLYDWYNSDTDILFTKNTLSDDYIKNIHKISRILTIRREISINFLIWRLYNSHYAKNNQSVHQYIKKLVSHYMSYFIDFFAVSKLQNNKKLTC